MDQIVIFLAIQFNAFYVSITDDLETMLGPERHLSSEAEQN